MTDYVNYGVGIEIFIILFFIYGVFVFFRALKNMSDEFKSSIILVGVSGIIIFIRVIILMVLLAQEFPRESPYWISFPFLGLLSAGFLVMGAQKFLEAMRK